MIKSLFSFVLIILLFLGSLGFVVYRLQDPTFVVDQAKEVNLYGRLSGNIGQFAQTDEVKSYGLDNDDISDILTSSIDGEHFYGFVDQAATAYLPWLSGKTDELNFRYDLTAIKAKIVDETASKITTKYENLPSCTQPQLRSWSFDKGLPSCQLPDGTLQAKSIANQIHASATKVVDGLPDSIAPGAPSSSLLEIRAKVALAFKAIYGIWALTALITLLFLVLFRSSGLVSLAVCFLLVGGLQIGFSLIGWDWIARTLGDFISGSGGSKAIVPIAIDFISVILGVMKAALGNISIGFLVTGAVLLTVGVIKKFHQPKMIQKLK